MDLSKYKIIFIHGLASKPPAKDLLTNWRLCLTENVRMYNPKLAADMDTQAKDLFHMAYWANVIPNHVEEDPKKYVKPLKELLKVRKDKGDLFHVSNEMKMRSMCRDLIQM